MSDMWMNVVYSRKHRENDLMELANIWQLFRQIRFLLTDNRNENDERTIHNPPTKANMKNEKKKKKTE